MSPVDSFVVISSLQGFDLSRSRSLQVLEIAAFRIHRSKWTTPRGVEAVSHSLKHALSTVASPAYVEVVIVYRNYDFFGVPSAFGGRTAPMTSRLLTEA